MSAKKKINFTDGPLFWQLLLFALPIMATGLLQMLYNATDKMVVGQFSGDPYALGAIGSTTFIAGLIINFMAGLGSGAGIIVSQLYGAKRESDTTRAVHTSIIMSIGIALVMSAIAYASAKPLLLLLGTREEFLSRALLYLNITYSGILASALYNTTSAILRAVGDSRTPLIIGAISGIVNVIFNLFFVIVCGMSVAGVGIATVIAQYFSAIATLVILSRKRGECYRFSLSKLRCDMSLLRRIIRLGVPTGLQSTCFSITNMITTSAVNTFSPAHITAHSVSGNIDGMLDVMSGSFMHSSMNATGQNLGAMKPKRIKRVFAYSMAQALGIMIVVSWTLRFFRQDLAAIFVSTGDDNFGDIVKYTAEWTGTMLATYCLQGAMNVALGTVRGLGYSIAPLLLNVIGTCVTRIVWVFAIFPLEPFRNFAGLAMLYPVSWLASTLLLSVIVIIAFRRLSRNESKLKV